MSDCGAEDRDSVTEPVRALLAALRRERDEAQFTQVLAALAGTDRRFAGALAQLLVREAPEGSNFRGGDGAVAESVAVPDELECRPEVRLWDTEAVSKGFVDLLFQSPGQDRQRRR